MKRLLVDLGNSRLKWRVEDNGRALARGDHAHAESDTWPSLEDANRDTIDTCLAGSVASSATNERLRSWCRHQDLPAPQFVAVRKEHLGLRVAYEDVRKLGVDRWLAMLGARACTGGALCVADAGTALTLDAVDEGGRHLGGLIAPGPETMARSLLSGTAGIGEAAQSLPDSPFAADTGDAVRAGALYASAALIERFAREAEARLNGAAALFLTGGARHAIGALLNIEWRDAPELVLDGLAALADANDKD